MPSRKILARFNGKCRTCGKTVRVGDDVYFAKHYGCRCVECGPHTADDQPLPSKPGSARWRRERGQVPTPRPCRSPAPGEKSGSTAAYRCSDGIHRFEITSVTEAVESALGDFAQNDGNREFIRDRMTYALSGRDNWAHHFTRDRMLAEIHSPTTDLLDAVDAMRQRLIGDLDLPTAPKRKVRRGQEYGDELDGDRWLNRETNCWDRSMREEKTRRTVTIGCNLSVSCKVRPDQLLCRGAAALALADLLSERGFNVGIVAMNCQRSPTSTVEKGVTRYTLKEPGMPMDITSVAFAMCEIAFFRVICALGGMRNWPGKAKTNLGFPLMTPEADGAGIDFLIDADVLNEEAAVSWLRDQLKNENESECQNV